MPARTLVATLLLLAAGCYFRIGPGAPSVDRKSFRPADLVRVSDRTGDRIVPLCHVLFVPQWDVPKGESFGMGNGSSSSPDRVKLDYYFSPFNGPHIRAEPVVVHDRKTVKAGGQTFDLAAGNLFVAAVRPDGSVQLTQLPSLKYPDPAAAIVAHVQRSLPNDVWLQGVDTRPLRNPGWRARPGDAAR